MFISTKNYDESTFHSSMFEDIESGVINNEAVSDNIKKQKLLKLKVLIASLLIAGTAKVGYDSYRIDVGRDSIVNEFDNYFDVTLNNPDYNKAYITIDNEVYSIEEGIENIIDGCRLLGMSDDETAIALLEYLPKGYVKEHLNTNVLKLRKTCINRYKEEKEN